MAFLRVCHSCWWLKHDVPPGRPNWPCWRLMSPMHTTSWEAAIAHFEWSCVSFHTVPVMFKTRMSKVS